jgi:hypothetical protein
MKLCILCEDANVEAARARSLEVLPADPNPNNAKLAIMKAKGIDPATVVEHLKVPVSANGEYPATHWFCFITVDEVKYQQLLSHQTFTIIEEGIPSEFLAKHGLQRIKSSTAAFNGI